MDTETRMCPNCGDRMTETQTVHQQTSYGDVVLRWTVCPSCHHVSLDDWDYVDQEQTAGLNDVR